MFFNKKQEIKGKSINDKEQNWKIVFSNNTLKDCSNEIEYQLKELAYCHKDNYLCFWHESKHLVTLKGNENIIDKVNYLTIHKANSFIPQYPTIEITDSNGVQWNRVENNLVSDSCEIPLSVLRIVKSESNYLISKYGKTIFECKNLNITDLQNAIDIALAKSHKRLALNVKPKKLRTKSKSKIMVTTETYLHGMSYERLDVITAECSYGMNIFKDLFAGIRDVVGGRSKSVQKIVRESKDIVIDELKQQAVEAGADAIIGIDLDYTEFGHIGMFLVIGSGTLVKFK